ncbi:MAG: hypothetical protein K9J13_01070 [Saprospiraceae bacterium]|nr:hypothetical protein [Saprospiraceae bacterium]
MSSEKNEFLSRGCCKSPKAYHRNDNIFKHECSMLDTFDWLKDINSPKSNNSFDCVEVRFKNNRKDFFKSPGEYSLVVGDIVAVEASPGHDIGIVSMTGEIVRLQMSKKNVNPKSEDIKKIYRKAKPTDIEKWVLATELEDVTMFKARKIATELNLDMKINDVEYQGDKTKAIFYYTAEDRVDFREMIKVFAEKFMVRIEMRQIGVRQESSRLGGIGSCGRELCCATWLTDFRSVSTSSARAQQLSLNPQKLAGQCSKLKCCLNYEYDVYIDALKEFPSPETILKTKKNDAHHVKTDIFKKIMWFSYINEHTSMHPILLEDVKKIIEMNKKGQKPDSLEGFVEVIVKQDFYENVIGQDDLTRFDSKKKKKGR